MYAYIYIFILMHIHPKSENTQHAGAASGLPAAGRCDIEVLPSDLR